MRSIVDIDNDIHRHRKEIARVNRNWHAFMRRERVRKSVIGKLGGKCVRCGFDDIRALEIDHIHGGGLAELRSLGSGDRLKFKLDLLPLKELLEKYQCLCSNCNSIKRWENHEMPGMKRSKRSEQKTRLELLRKNLEALYDERRKTLLTPYINTNLSQREIGEKIGIHGKTVGIWLRKYFNEEPHKSSKKTSKALTGRTLSPRAVIRVKKSAAMTPELRQRLSVMLSGSNSPNWKGDKASKQAKYLREVRRKKRDAVGE